MGWSADNSPKMSLDELAQQLLQSNVDKGREEFVEELRSLRGSRRRAGQTTGTALAFAITCVQLSALLMWQIHSAAAKLLLY